MGDITKLDVYQKSLELCLLIYRASSRFPSDERFGLTSQMRRAAASIGANIAEGGSGRSDADRVRFNSYALGSIQELKHFLRLAESLSYLSAQEARHCVDLCEETGKMLNSLNRFLRQSITKTQGLTPSV